MSIYNARRDDGVVSIDVARLSDVEPAELGVPMPSETGTWQHTGYFKGMA